MDKIRNNENSKSPGMVIYADIVASTLKLLFVSNLPPFAFAAKYINK